MPRSIRPLALVAFVSAACGPASLVVDEGPDGLTTDSAAAPLFAAFPDEVGVAQTGVFDVLGDPAQLNYELRHGFKVFGGDMLLGDEHGTPPAIDSDLAVAEQGLASNSGVANLWPRGVVPYVIDGTIGNHAPIDWAIAIWQLYTPVRFVKRTTQKDYVVFTAKGAGCWAWLGKIGGPQEINLGTGCLNAVSTVEHEIGHALGAIHEHQRPNRDSYVNIIWGNVNAAYKSAFDLVPAGADYYGTSYETASVMHYSSTAFSVDPAHRLTITRKDGSAIAYPAGVTTRDAAGMTNVYNKLAATITATPPPRCGIMKAGEGLVVGKSYTSCDGRFSLVQQSDGNLVEYQAGKGALWSSQTNGRAGYATIMQGDGNLVIYTRFGSPIWSTSTSGHPGAYLALQNDGNLVLYAGGKAVWATMKFAR